MYSKARLYILSYTIHFLCLGLVCSSCIYGQQNNNIANYDYFLGHPLTNKPNAINKNLAFQNYKDSLVFDRKTGTYTKYKIINGKPIPIYASKDLRSLLKTEGKLAEKKYVKEQSLAIDKLFEYRVPSLYAEKSLYNRILQNSYADGPELQMHVDDFIDDIKSNLDDVKSWRYKKLKEILPSLIVGFGGTFSLQAGYRIQEVRNLAIPQSLRVTGSPDFQVNMNVKGDVSLSNKLLLPALSLNNFSNFQEEIFKASLQYKATSEEIIREISIIQTNFDTKSSLIPSTQSLLGANIKLQFGRLFVTGAIGQVRSQIQTTQITQGSAKTKFKMRSSDYDENQHFFLSQYFYDNYENALSRLPAIQSGIRVTRIEVWISNRQNKTQEVRQAIALMDLAEPNPYNTQISPSVADNFPRNGANNLYTRLNTNASFRDASQADNLLSNIGLITIQDYEKSYMRKLTPNEYYLNEELGYLMLRAPLQSDEILAVAYEYSANGQRYQVGEFSNEQTPQSPNSTQAVVQYKTATLFLKMLKSTAHNVSLPIWDLMMKNVYSIGYGATKKEDIKFQIFYEQPGGIAKNYIPSEEVNSNAKGTALLEITGMDKVGAVPNAKGVDGEFDFIEDVTFIPELGKIVFPTIQPFGSDMRRIFTNEQEANKYVFDLLYDTIKAVAKDYTNFDRFLITGESSSGFTGGQSNLRIGFNLRPGSVKIYSGGYLLEEGKDYIADYNLGSVRIINPTYVNAQIPLRIQYENNNQFNFRNYLFMGLRWDYHFKNKKWILGGTMVNLNETPFYRKLEYNNDPINNSAFQVDLKFKDEMPWVTKGLSIFPGIDRNIKSNIKAQTEVAMLVPGNSLETGAASTGGIFIDDFESVKFSIDIKSSFAKWILASTPEGSVDENNQLLFPEGTLKNDLSYGFNRARMSWYILDPTYQDPDRIDNPYVGQYEALSAPEVRQTFLSELFPNRSRDIFQDRLATFDVTFYPHERGPYNFDARTSTINSDGTFKNPKEKWGGIMRSLNQVDFVSSNVGYLEFWVLDPFVNKPQSDGGSMYIQLGNISEDILKDGNKSYENGLPTDANPAIVENSVWGIYPANPTQFNFAFDNNTNDRSLQDVGFDGLSSLTEQDTFRNFVLDIIDNFDPNAELNQLLRTDPASDDYVHYAENVDEFGNVTKTLLESYKYVSNPDGNSPVATSSAIRGSFLPPDSEDLNNDNVLNQNEAYFQYRLDFKPNMMVGNNNIVDLKNVEIALPNGSTRNERWYLFRVPLLNYQHRFGNITSLQSVRFMRMFWHGFQDTSVTFRFATMQFVANQWDIFRNELDTLGGLKPVNNPNTSFLLQTVNIEENERKTPIPYMMPPGVIRQSNLSSTAGTLLQNEQSQSVIFNNLAPKDARGIFKNVNYDLRNYEQIKMFIHAEGNRIADNQLYAVIRLGEDLVSNYYEVKIPLKISADGSNTSASIWPIENNLSLLLSDLSNIKQARDISSTSSLNYFSETRANGSVFAIMGNPSLASVGIILLGVYNAGNTPIDGEVWFNELKLSGLNEKPSWAMTGNVNIKLANFGNINVSGSYKSIGWGSLEQRLNERLQEDERQLSFTSNLDLHHLFPQKIGLQLPFYVSFTETVKKPKFYPHRSDILLEDVLATYNTAQDSILRLSLNYSSSYQISFPSIIIFKNTPKWFPLSPSLFSFNYTFSDYRTYTPQIQTHNKTTYQGGLNYNYQVPIGEITPFKKLKFKSPYLKFITDFNLRLLPSTINFRMSFNRLFSKRINRNLEAFEGISKPYFEKYLNFTKTLDIQWPITKSLRLTYNARQESSVDEPYGDIDNNAKRDSFWREVWNLGDNNYFSHNLSANYTIPFKIIPALSFIKSQVNYRTTYSWKLNYVPDNGNEIQNTQQFGFYTDFNLTEIYFKSRKYRRALLNISNSTFKSKLTNQFVRFITMVKSVRLTYNENSGTTIPGWAPNISTWGASFRQFTPGADFIFGYTPSQDWFRNTLIRNRWVISNPLFTGSTNQLYKQDLKLQANISPIKDLRIDINMSQEFTKNFQFQVQDVNGDQNFEILNATSTGSFSTTHLAFTLFNGLSDNNLLDIAERLNENRQILSRRLANKNVYANKNVVGSYFEGYGPYSQDVLIPAFIAAVGNTSAELIPFVRQTSNELRANPFGAFAMLPNWSITYTGLTNIPFIGKIFNSLIIRHKYSSKLDMSNYTSSLKFSDPLGAGWPSFIDPQSGNFIPYFLVPNVSISEQYDPLISLSGVIQTKWQFSAAIKRTKQSTMSLSDYQISEANVFGVNGRLGWVSEDFELPFSMSTRQTKNSTGNITFSTDIGIENNKTQNIRLDENIRITASGLDRFNIKVNLGIIVDKTFTAEAYFEQLNTYPQLSASPPILVSRFGIRATLNLDYQKSVTSSTILPKGFDERAPIDGALQKLKKP